LAPVITLFERNNKQNNRYHVVLQPEYNTDTADLLQSLYYSIQVIQQHTQVLAEKDCMVLSIVAVQQQI